MGGGLPPSVAGSSSPCRLIGQLPSSRLPLLRPTDSSAAASHIYWGALPRSHQAGTGAPIRVTCVRRGSESPRGDPAWWRRRVRPLVREGAGVRRGARACARVIGEIEMLVGIYGVWERDHGGRQEIARSWASDSASVGLARVCAARPVDSVEVSVSSRQAFLRSITCLV